MKKVAILLSTYNGERYIEEQIESLLKQTYQNIEIYIRDDGSTDNTVAVLEQYRGMEHVHLFTGEGNLGYPQGFFALLDMNIEADYFGFCDQDDVWYPDKIERAVNALDAKGQDKPVLFYAACDYCDENLNFIKPSPKFSFQPEFRNSLFTCLALGYTMVMNKPAKELVTKRRAKKHLNKDEWMGMELSAFGELIYDSKPCAKYRRNPGSFSITRDNNFFSIQMERFKLYFRGDGFKQIHEWHEEFYEEFADELSPEKRKELEFFINKKYNIIRNLKKVCYPHRLRYSWGDELLVRIMFLFGQI